MLARLQIRAIHMIAFDAANSLIGLSSMFSPRTIHVDPAKLPFSSKAQREPCYDYMTFTSICLGNAASFLGSVIVRTPSLNPAWTFLPSTNVGSVKLRMNSPYFRSTR